MEQILKVIKFSISYSSTKGGVATMVPLPISVIAQCRCGVGIIIITKYFHFCMELESVNHLLLYLN